MAPHKDIVGQRFGYVTVQCVSNIISCGTKKWQCICDCGELCYFLTSNLKRKSTLPSCGCKTNENRQKGNREVASKIRKDLTGKQINNLAVIKFTGYKENINTINKATPFWLVRCNCGFEFDIREKHLIKNNPQKTCVSCAKNSVDGTKIGCIYKITCTPTNKIYVGATTVSLDLRLNRHKNAAESNRSNSPLSKAITQHGIEAFTIEILEESAAINLEQLEDK